MACFTVSLTYGGRKEFDGTIGVKSEKSSMQVIYRVFHNCSPPPKPNHNSCKRLNELSDELWQITLLEYSSNKYLILDPTTTPVLG